MNRIQSILLILVPLFLYQCGGSPLANVERQLAKEAGSDAVVVAPGFRRIIDEEAGVVCWSFYGNGIDCMLISDTLLNDSPASGEGEGQ